MYLEGVLFLIHTGDTGWLWKVIKEGTRQEITNVYAYVHRTSTTWDQLSNNLYGLHCLRSGSQPNM